jgi:cytochrome c oxidase assembly factor CtaG
MGFYSRNDMHMHMQMPQKMMWGPMWLPALPPDAARLLQWHPQPIPVLPALCLLLLVGYFAGVIAMHRKHHRWPVGRTISWVLGVISVAGVTGTGVGGYGMGMFSVHMVQHMVLSMLSPILLLLARPVTLALRALPTGHGPRGRYRRGLLRVLRSKPARVLASPALTLPIFILSLYGLYFTPLFDILMANWFGHTAMLLHFLAIGLALFWPILAMDPNPHKASAGMRLVELFITVPFHAIFGVVVMMTPTLIVPFFAHPPASWHVHVLADQNAAGGIAWSFAEIPTLMVLIAVFAQWKRSSDREAARYERSEERTGGKAMADYNAWLASIAARGVRERPGSEEPQTRARPV